MSSYNYSSSSNYSPFGNYFGLATVVNTLKKEDTIPPLPIGYKPFSSDLNPQAAPFVPSSSSSSSSNSSSPPVSPNENEDIQYKLTIQRQRAIRNQNQYSKVRFCIFCQRSGQSIHVQKSHTLRGDDGCVSCPFLRGTVCPNCGATGDDAHTIKYCPANQPNIIFT